MDRPILRWKFYLVTTPILLLAIVEHILSIAVNSANYDWKGSENSTLQNFLQMYCKSSHAFILESCQCIIRTYIYYNFLIIINLKICSLHTLLHNII